MSSTGVLNNAFTRLDDTLSDYRATVAIGNFRGLLARFTAELDAEPMHSFLLAAVPAADFDKWLQSTGAQRTSGFRVLDWPADMACRVGLQISVCRMLADGQIEAIPFAYHHFRVGSERSASAAFRKMGADLLHPLVRDLKRLASQRVVSAALSEVIRTRPTSDDAALDLLLIEACDAIRDVAPSAHQRALEKLWDAWERTKSQWHEDKKTSVGLMLDSIDEEPRFRAMLEAEAKTLTEIGNTFRIRHHEMNRPAVATTAQVDYLFHRLMAMLRLVLR